jgi:hypothetical protein
MRPHSHIQKCGLVALVLLLTSPVAASDCGIFVSPDGTDTPEGGLSGLDPCRTINFAIGRAQTAGLDCVILRAGTYNEVMNLAEGISLVGGFDVSWARGPDVLTSENRRCDPQGYDMKEEELIRPSAIRESVYWIFSNNLGSGWQRTANDKEVGNNKT